MFIELHREGTGRPVYLKTDAIINVGEDVTTTGRVCCTRIHMAGGRQEAVIEPMSVVMERLLEPSVKARPTPGPWRKYKTRDGTLVINTVGESFGCYPVATIDSDNEADADLITAAPGMFRGLRSALLAMEEADMTDSDLFRELVSIVEDARGRKGIDEC